MSTRQNAVQSIFIVEVILVLLAYPDHVLADSHQLVVQFRINHLHLLQLEDPLVAALCQLTLVLLQTLDNLQRDTDEHI